MEAVPQEILRAALAGDPSLSPTGEEYIPMPMWGTIWRVSDAVDERRIREMLTPIIPDMGSLSMADLHALADDWGVDASDIDRDEIEEAISEAVEESEDGMMGTYGWEAVGATGILAIDIGDDLYLGVHGAGYDFFVGHWIPLYSALGYRWHEQMEREDRVMDLARQMVGHQRPADLVPDILAALEGVSDE